MLVVMGAVGAGGGFGNVKTEHCVASAGAEPDHNNMSERWLRSRELTGRKRA